LNKIFPALYLQLLATGTDNLIDALKITLQSKGYPKDAEFKARLLDAKLYAPGDRAAKTKLIPRSSDKGR
jgi:hypothetical protein